MSEHKLKTSELLERSSSELLKQLQDLKEELYTLRFQHHTGQLENFMKLQHVKRNIARIKTCLKQKES